MAKLSFYAPTKLSENIRETPEGFLLCLNVPIARTGWMEYGEGETPLKVGDDGLVHVYRSAEEVFRPETIASFEGKDITVKHPTDFITPENWNYLSKGVSQNIRRADQPDEDGEESLLADLLVKEAFTIKLVKAGLREVSCGYEAEYEQTGEGKGIQTNIIGNHIALVEQGRAGSTYAINDEKGKANMGPKAIEYLKKKFGTKVVDEAMKEDKEEKKESKDEGAYDELVESVKDLMSRVEGFMKQGEEGGKKGLNKEDKSKDEDKEEAKKKPMDEDKEASKKDDSEDDDMAEDAEGGEIEERVKALEAAVAKLLEKMGAKDEDKEESEDEDEESESEDDDNEGMAEDEDADAEGEEGEQSQKKKTGDQASRAEILAPGLKVAKKSDVKVEALKAAYKTKDGKVVIDQLSGGKPDFKSEVLFIAASEVLKARRGTGLEGSKNAKAFDSVDQGDNVPMTAEKMNEINAAAWAARK